MILCPTGWPVYHRASKRLSNAARSCARHDRERNALSCWQTWKTGTFMHPSLWAGHSLKKVMHRGWAYFQARLAFTMAAFNVLVQWYGFHPNASGFVPLSIAEFGL